jgi:hypothetical protein
MWARALARATSLLVDLTWPERSVGCSVEHGKRRHPAGRLAGVLVGLQGCSTTAMRRH